MASVTPIYTSKKLEKFVKKLVQPRLPSVESPLGKWNATLFYLNRKKYLLFINKETLYNLVIRNVTAADLDPFEDLFLDAFHTQLRTDGLAVDKESLAALVGTLQLHPTNNDRKINGHINQRLFEIDLWMARHDPSKPLPMEKWNHYINQGPVQLTKGPRYTTGTIEMTKLLEQEGLLSG